jgi:hypothetical protein
MKHNSRTIWHWLCTTILVLLQSLLSTVAVILVSKAATPYGSSMLTSNGGGGTAADGSDGITLTFNVITCGAAQIRSRGKNHYYLLRELILYKYLNENVFVTYL